MSENELLLAISDIVSKNSKVLEQKIDGVEERLTAKIDEVDQRLTARIDALDAKIDEVDQRLSGQIDTLSDQINGLENQVNGLSKRMSGLSKKVNGLEKKTNDMSYKITKINLQLENDVVPRLSTIETCYTSTYDRYRDGAGRIETLEMDMDVMKSVVKEYGEKLVAMTA